MIDHYSVAAKSVSVAAETISDSCLVYVLLTMDLFSVALWFIFLFLFLFTICYFYVMMKRTWKMLSIDIANIISNVVRAVGAITGKVVRFFFVFCFLFFII